MGNGIRGAIALAAIALSAIASMAWGGTSPATPPAAAAQGFAPDQGTGASGENLVVYLMTIGQGHAIWEKFGHNAIWVEDRATGQAIAYNYGIFDFDQPGFYERLVRGNMLYQMVPFDARQLTEAYAADDRTIWLQELALSPRQRADLVTFLEWNARPENRSYLYDYYRDNCSTRVRDALDRALGGQLRTALTNIPTPNTYRSEGKRLTESTLPEYTGLVLAMGDFVDRPLDAWDDSFIPMRLRTFVSDMTVTDEAGRTVPLVVSERVLHESALPPPPDTAHGWRLWYLAVGLVFAGLLAGLGFTAARSRAAAVAFSIVTFAWFLLLGVLGLVLAFLWAFTGHVGTYHNENLLLVHPLLLGLAFLAPVAAIRRGPGRAAIILALTTAVLGILALVLQVLPPFDQHNGEILGLILPAHLAITWVLSRWPVQRVSSRMDASSWAWRAREARAAGRHR
jgi:hypothetical protein